MSRLHRFLNAKSVAVVGGGWASNVIEQLQKSDYDGQIWPVHPKKESVKGIKAYANLDSLPHAPDAVFLGVNRFQAIELTGQLSEMNAGGMICFASGFAEAEELGESESAKLIWKPNITSEVDLDGLSKVMRLVEALEDDDDVQTVTTNVDAPDDVMEAFAAQD